MSRLEMSRLESLDCRYPSSLAEAVALLSDASADRAILAGGTDLLVQWHTGAVRPPAGAISVLAVPELQRLEDCGDSITIGAAVTHATLRDSAIVRSGLPALAAAAATIGAIQIQNRGTLGGSIANASPAGDVAPALLTSNGSVVLVGAKGRREVPLERFFLGYRRIDRDPDELLVEFTLPKVPAGHHEGFRKLGTRKAQAISKVMGAWRGACTNGIVTSFRVALGSVAPTPVRLPLLEDWITGRRIDAGMLSEIEQRVATEVHPIDDIRSTADYRRWVSGRLVRSFVEGLARTSS